MTPLAKQDRLKNYPAVGDKLQHAHCDQAGTVLAVNPHSNPRNTRRHDRIARRINRSR